MYRHRRIIECWINVSGHTFGCALPGNLHCTEIYYWVLLRHIYKRFVSGSDVVIFRSVRVGAFLVFLGVFGVFGIFGIFGIEAA